ncbi:MAG: hypothetical protein HXK87_01845 [Lachnospiraceae bacterium]|nr:hypothetical protein [Lachnospiraceae bacterium]
MAETDFTKTMKESGQTEPQVEASSAQAENSQAEPSSAQAENSQAEAVSAQAKDSQAESDSAKEKADIKSDFAESSLVVEGFRFLTTADAEKAKLDLAKINYLKKNLGYATSTALDAVYEKAIENQIFSTPVGWQFLFEIRMRLISSELKGTAFSPIPVTMPLSRREAKEQAEQELQKRNEKERTQERGSRGKLSRKAGRMIQFSLALNLVLVFLVAAMFVILNFSQTDNIVNYKRNITNRFAEREERLKEREAAIREKERKLHLSDKGDSENATSGLATPDESEPAVNGRGK